MHNQTNPNELAPGLFDLHTVNNDSKKNTWQNQFKLDALNVLDLKSILNTTQQNFIKY